MNPAELYHDLLAAMYLHAHLYEEIFQFAPVCHT